MQTTPPDNTTRAALPVLDVLQALCGYAITGASNKDLAEATRLAPPAITRACATLVAQGWCRKSEETGRFYPTHQFTRLAFRVLDDIQRAEQRLQDQHQALTGHASI